MAMHFPAKTNAKGSGQQILVVDDEVLTVEAVRARLQLEGYQTVGAYSGEKALEILEGSLHAEAASVDLLILDRSMPEMSGLDVCRRIKNDARLRHIPVLMLTALATIRDKVTGLDTGADDYVTKPYNERELLARIHALLRASRMEQELFQRNQQLATLNRIVSAITSSIELDEILTTALRGIQDLMPVEACSLLVEESRGSGSYRRHLTDRGGEWLFEQQIEPVGGLIGHVIRTGTVLIANDAADDPRFRPEFDRAGDLETRSLLIVPLVVKDTLIGAIETINRDRGDFSQSDVDLLRSVAASVAIAWENAHLFKDLRTAYQQVETNQRRWQATASTLQALFDGITDGL